MKVLGNILEREDIVSYNWTFIKFCHFVAVFIFCLTWKIKIIHISQANYHQKFLLKENLKFLLIQFTPLLKHLLRNNMATLSSNLLMSMTSFWNMAINCLEGSFGLSFIRSKQKLFLFGARLPWVLCLNYFVSCLNLEILALRIVLNQSLAFPCKVYNAIRGRAFLDGWKLTHSTPNKHAPWYIYSIMFCFFFY